MRKQTRAILMLAGITLSGVAGAQTQKNQQATKKTDVSPAVASQPVTGAGTAGQITKWVGSNPINYTVGDSIITEDKFGNIGVGTTTPTSKFTVAGIIEATLGGVKFPDGSIQTTAGMSSLTHDATLAGNGTVALPLGIAAGGVGTVQIANAAVTGPKIAAGAVGNPQLADAAVTRAKIAAGAIGTTQIADDAVTGPKIATASVGTAQLADSAITSPKLAPAAVQTIHLADSSVTASKIAPGQVVRALNGLSDTVELVAGSNITLTPAGNTLTISGTGQGGSTASQQPFQITNLFSSGDSSALTQFEVPQGKRLVIENVSANATTGEGGRPECAFILTTIINGGQPSFHYFPANFSQFETNGSRQFFTGQVAKIYAEGLVAFNIRNFGASTISGAVTISGYLVDL